MAAIITGTIKVDVSRGEFAGIYTGNFSYDDTNLTNVGTEIMNIDGVNADVSGLLSFSFDFLDFPTGLTPVTYTENDIFNFPDGLILYFENGVPTQFGAIIDPGNNGGIWTANNGLMFGDPNILIFSFRNGTSGGRGIVTLEIDELPLE